MKPERYHEALYKLKAICLYEDRAEKALEYCSSSSWSIFDMVEFIQMTGELPGDEWAKTPNEALIFYRHLNMRRTNEKS